MTLTTWLLFCAASILPVISPGPAILLTINNSLRFGTKPTLFSAFGNTCGLIILGFAICFGLGAIMAASSLIFNIIKIIGAAYLVYLGIKLWRAKDGIGLENPLEGQTRSKAYLFFQGLFLALTNPKAIVLLAALFPQFLNPKQDMLLQVTILSCTYSALCFINHVFLAYAAGNMKRWLSSDKRMKILCRSIGASFVGFGASLVASLK